MECPMGANIRDTIQHKLLLVSLYFLIICILNSPVVRMRNICNPILFSFTIICISISSDPIKHASILEIIVLSPNHFQRKTFFEDATLSRHLYSRCPIHLSFECPHLFDRFENPTSNYSYYYHRDPPINLRFKADRSPRS